MRGWPDIWPWIEAFLSGLVPLALLLALVVVCAFPLGLPAIGLAMPMLPLAAVYYWAIYRPKLLPFWVTFLIGLLHDILSGAPTGMWAAIYVCVQAITINQRPIFYGKSFAVVWFGFGILAASAAAAAWLLTVVFFSRYIAIEPAIFQYFTTVVLYPVLTLVFGLIHRELLRSS